MTFAFFTLGLPIMLLAAEDDTKIPVGLGPFLLSGLTSWFFSRIPQSLSSFECTLTSSHYFVVAPPQLPKDTCSLNLLRLNSVN